MKLDQASPVEPRASPITANSSSTTLTGNPKVSKFGVKSGFVIPKNKLSGSLVPIFRGAVKVESDPVKEESSKKIQRKTKWGTDLTQDATVQRGRTLAYQTRVEQITKQLKSGVLEKGDDDLIPQTPKEIPNDESSKHQADNESQKLEMLELEKREAIGEILKLNPSYKAPLDYKPVMKEASIPVPVKLYPGLNFVGLILGPGSNTQKRLEEETGARIRIQGIKTGSTEKVEITSSDKSDVQGDYEELYVHVSADTFEKVDAAVGLIELLVTPLSGHSVMVSTAPSSISGDRGNVLEQSQGTLPGHVMPGPVVNQGAMQSVVRPMQLGFLPQVQFHPYPALWYPAGPVRPPNNFGPPSNSSGPVPNNVIQFPSSPLNPSERPQFFVGHPPSAAGSALAPRNPSLVSPRLQPPMQGFQWPCFREAPPNNLGSQLRVHPIPGSQQHLPYPSLPSQPNPAVPHQGTSNQPRTTGPGPGLSLSQPMSNAPSGQPPNMPQASSVWSASTVATPSQPFLFQRPSVVSQPLMISGPGQSNVPAIAMSGPSGNMVAPVSFPPLPSTAQLPNSQVNHPVAGPNFSFVIHQRSPLASNPGTTTAVASMPAFLPSSSPSSTLGPMQAPSSMMPPSPAAQSASPRFQSLALAQTATQALSPSLNQSTPVAHMQPVGPQRSAPNQSMVGASLVPAPPPPASLQLSVNPSSISGSLPSPQHTSATTPKPQRPSSGDFTFQPLGSPHPVSQVVSRPSDQRLQAPSVPPTSIVQPSPAPQTPSYRPSVHNSGPQPVMQGFPSTRPNNQMIQSQSQVRPPPRFLEFANPNPGPPTASAPHMGPRSFTQAPQMSNFPGRFPPQMINPAQLHQNQSSSTIRPRSFLVPNQHYNTNPNFSSGRPASSPSGNQVYDPFSPTSISTVPQKLENSAKVRKQEDDPEYDDLMASVGVR